MFRTLELGTLLIKASLGDPTRLDSEPNMVRLVFPSDILTILGVGLGVPAVMFVSLDPFDMRSFLTGHVLSDIFLKRSSIQ